VRGVPKTILNDRLFIDGAVPEPELVAAVSQAAWPAAPEVRP
jgi:predicted DsbA family dithiol-disulfide isomerase